MPPLTEIRRRRPMPSGAADAAPAQTFTAASPGTPLQVVVSILAAPAAEVSNTARASVRLSNRVSIRLSELATTLPVIQRPQVPPPFEYWRVLAGGGIGTKGVVRQPAATQLDSGAVGLAGTVVQPEGEVIAGGGA